ncbi:MAG: hypothetical protein ACXW3M_15235, partial [Rhodoplanes sp.]
GEQIESLAGELGVGQRPRRAHPGAHLVAVALGQQIGDIALSLKWLVVSSGSESDRPPLAEAVR